jgi:phytoene dehydrogenase-like protein
LFGPIGTFADRFRWMSLIHKTRAGRIEDQFARPEGLTLDLLRWHGFSDAMIDRFFRPFFGGIFLERELVTSSRLFRFLFRMFAEGQAAVPNTGMGAIPEQLASRLPEDSVRFDAVVSRAEPGRAVLANGESIDARAIVVATDAPAAVELLGSQFKPPASRGATCIYFAASKSPIGEPILVLNADENGPVNNLAVMSDVAPGYAPPGATLISVSVLGIPEQDDAKLEFTVREQLTNWYGPSVRDWRRLRTYRIAHALPDQTAPALDSPSRPVALGDGLFICGDHRDTASIHGAMHSGWRAAQAVAASLSGEPQA